MSLIFAKIALILGSLVTFLTFQQGLISQDVPIVSPSPISINTPISTIQPAEVPIITVSPIPVMTPDLPSIIQNINDLKNAVASYTPEPTPTPQIVYVTSVPISTPVPTPSTKSITLWDHEYVTTYPQSNYIDVSGFKTATLNVQAIDRARNDYDLHCPYAISTSDDGVSSTSYSGWLGQLNSCNTDITIPLTSPYIKVDFFIGDDYLTAKLFLK